MSLSYDCSVKLVPTTGCRTFPWSSCDGRYCGYLNNCKFIILTFLNKHRWDLFKLFLFIFHFLIYFWNFAIDTASWLEGSKRSYGSQVKFTSLWLYFSEKICSLGLSISVADSNYLSIFLCSYYYHKDTNETRWEPPCVLSFFDFICCIYFM